MRKTIVIAVAVVLLSLSLACSKKPVNPDEPEPQKPEPTPLFKPAMSYWSFDKTKQTLGYTNWEIVEDRRPLVSDRRPPFRLVVIKVPNFKDGGYTGDLVLWFYNDRLMKTQFYVQNLKEYLPHAEGDQGMMMSNEGSTFISPHTRVWAGKDADGKTYLGMQDEILKNKMDDWVLRYSNQ
ncbi:hypothetical protein Acid345_1159 [Candidatus Koribacter versatilis Ellin345]|uniref:Lipoprotein n=1 Tax=Koribacter versatilis (strain Ellin345) TaxID=204669 RepID=Q1ISI8_KORVE|nr:hypothetical protein [Candidatus Koribacter versatilis]ABF40162.1 hypothetical protein Acid345_1159 [Candidatus Koribacter versatilis Ellin345]